MRARQKAIDSYGEVNVVSGVNSADNVQLIQMLFDGLVESLKAAEGQIKRNEINAKAKSLARASKIVLGLQNALDFEEGGEIATNLNELYSYVVRRLFHVNAHSSKCRRPFWTIFGHMKAIGFPELPIQLRDLGNFRILFGGDYFFTETIKI